MNFESIYGDFVICKCENRERFLRNYHNEYGTAFSGTTNAPAFINCRKCEWDRFRSIPGATFRID